MREGGEGRGGGEGREGKEGRGVGREGRVDADELEDFTNDWKQI